MSNWYSEITSRLSTEVSDEMTRIGSGSCSGPDLRADQVALRYSERIGFVMGLSKAMQIAEDMEKGKAP